MAVAQLVLRGHGREEAAAALAAVGDGFDVDAAHDWLMEERRGKGGGRDVT